MLIMFNFQRVSTFIIRSFGNLVKHILKFKNVNLGNEN